MEEKEQVAKLATAAGGGEGVKGGDAGPSIRPPRRRCRVLLRLGGRPPIPLQVLASVSRSDADADRFSRAQSDPELRLVPILFEHSLMIEPEEKVDQVPNLFDQLFGQARVKITSPPSDSEIEIALRILGGCCLFRSDSSRIAYECKALQVLMHLLSTRGDAVKCVCLDSLISLLVHSTESLLDFEKCNGIEEVTTLLRDKQASEQLSYMFIPPSESSTLTVYDLQICHNLHSYFDYAEMWRVFATPHGSSEWNKRIANGGNTRPHKATSR